ncbi:MAG: tryptophan 7-halogenase [Sulfurovaceae bacterium]
MSKREISSDVVIIGAGPAGSIAAASLAQKGYSVSIVEKTPFPRFVIGESLLPRCNELLSRNGMLDAVRNAGYMVKHGAAFEGNHKLEKYDFSENIGQTFGSSYQVKREEFDQLLLDEALKYGATLYKETEVVGFDPESSTSKAVDKNGDEIELHSKFTIDASGYGRVLPRLLDLDAPSELEIRDAVFTRIKEDIRPEDGTDGYIYIFIHGNNDGWIWTRI